MTAIRIATIGIAAFGYAALLCGCVTIQPKSIGRDTYMVETLGSNMSYGPALRTANTFCSDQGKRMQLVTANKGGTFVSANTSLTFMCLEENDPRYKAPVLHRDNGISIPEM